MSYLFVVVIGTVAGWLAGQQFKGSELPVTVDLAAGALGAVVVVLLSRMVGPPAAGGYLVSTLAAIIGAVSFLLIQRRVMKEKAVAVKPRRRP